MFSWMWPTKEVWERISSEDSIAVTGRGVDRWRTSGNQKKGDVFMLKIVKPRTKFTVWLRNIGFRFNKNWDIGQERIIDRIQFMQSPYSAIAFPVRYAVSISNERGLYKDWMRREFSAEITTGILIEFPHPIKINHFTITIIEPASNVYWGIGRIDIREVRLPFWRTDIK